MRAARPIASSIALLALLVPAACAPPESAEPPAALPSGAVLAAPTIYEVNFDERPSYLPSNTVVLTFDDGPDDADNTRKTLDVLKEKNVKATFFINTENASNVNMDPAMQLLVRRIVDEGHELANHSVHHLALALQTPAQLEDEIAGVEQTVCKILGSRAPRLTLFRAPFGDPYLGPLHGVGYDTIAPIVAKHAVHIGWALDSNDWRVPGDPNAVFTNVTSLLKTPGQGSYGVILMHSIHPQTVAALPRIIDYIRSKGFVLKSTEDVVRARFGKASGALIPGTSNCTGPGMIDTPDGGAGPADAQSPPPRDAAAAAADTRGGSGGSGGGGGGAGGEGGEGGGGQPPGKMDASADPGSGGGGGGGRAGQGGRGGASGAGGGAGSGGRTGDSTGEAGSSGGGSGRAPGGGCVYASGADRSGEAALLGLLLVVVSMLIRHRSEWPLLMALGRLKSRLHR